MRGKLIIGNVNTKLVSFRQRISGFAANGRRLILGAALVHVALATGLFCAGLTKIAPSIIDHDGIMSSFAYDSYEYQHGAIRLAEVLKQEGIRSWIGDPAPLHVKLLSSEFVVLGPLFGYSTLSAEPLNLFCYLAIIIIVFALGREIGGRRVGLLSALIVGLWPTFLLHTVQFLKDPLFIFGALAFVLFLTGWLTRIYSRSIAVVTSATMILIIFILLRIRINFGIFIFALLFFSLVLLIIRQLIERRLLYWNMLCALVAVLMTGLLLLPYRTPNSQKFKHYPSDQGGQPKAIATAGLEPSIISYGSRSSKVAPSAYTEPFLAAANQLVRRISSVRSRFAVAYPYSGSGVDTEVEFKNFRDVFDYLPRALEIGLWAPFPDMWLTAGKRVRSAGRLLSGVETLFIYLCQLLALFALLVKPRALVSWLLLTIITFGVTALALAVSNIGTLYRFRYTFWILLIIVAMKGFQDLFALAVRRRASSRPSTRERGQVDDNLVTVELV